jgi:hypothetical protein
MSYLKRKLRSVFKFFDHINSINNQLELLTDINLELLRHEQMKHVKNAFNRFGSKTFSQNDEDGLTLEIIKRLGLNSKQHFFAELGIGNGTECNSIILAAMGYRGIWIGNEVLSIDVPMAKTVKYLKAWITAANVLPLLHTGMELYNIKDSGSLKIISVDLDGNDYYVSSEILKQFHPDLFIAEYNALFPPPLEFCIEYNPEHSWSYGDSYFGCSLATYNTLMEAHGYFLVCCNCFSGANAFFVKNEYRDRFPEVPESLEEKYVPPFYILGNRRNFHKNLVKTVNHVLANQ